jgi:lipopolysaccharide/colanic/teichoic acid biosynthesis glycosyltransferase
MGALDLSLEHLSRQSQRMSQATAVPAAAVSALPAIVSEGTFTELLTLERKRAERSGKAFMLMIAELQAGPGAAILGKLLPAITSATRDTDITGWFAEGSALGTIFTEMTSLDEHTIGMVQKKILDSAANTLTGPEFASVEFAFYRVPDEWSNHKPGKGTTVQFYPEIVQRDASQSFRLAIKRGMDVVFSCAALLVAAPLFLLIAAAIKMTSQGPVFFRQERVGRHGVPFFCLKFRTMQVSNDSAIHRAYVEKLIRGEVSKEENGGVFKIKADPRVTKAGRLLRKTSLDELPQFINVLKGEMSLVGPRPPIPYELSAYDAWHRRRVLEAKPGITGLWQVLGRSRTTFDEMVRLDLQYARNWSLWLDLKILFQTPWAVISGSGAH